MKLYKLKMIRAAFFGPALLLLASCSSYQYAGYDNDGIYSSDNREAVAANEEEDSYGESQYYEQLFAEQSAQYDQLPEEGMIFTNIDAYSSTGAYDESAFVDQELAYQGGNAPWGEDIDEVSINIYSNMSPFYHGPRYMGGFYDPYMRYGYGGFYGHRWSPWGYGGYGYGYGHRFGFYSPWNTHRWGWRSGWGHYNPYRHGYGYGYGGVVSRPAYGYNDRNVSYSRTGRNANYNEDSGLVRSSSIVRSSRRDSYSNSSEVRADRTRSALARTSRSLSDSNDRTYRTRSSRVESPKTQTRRSAINSRSTDTRREVRSTQTRRSYNTPQLRRRTSTSRSSGTVRSAPTTRSSGTRSSGTRTSRSRGGRGN